MCKWKRTGNEWRIQKEAAAEPFLPATGRLLQQIVYKQAAPQRHQTFFMAFRRMDRTVKKYNDRSNYIKLLTQIEQVG